jgi:hypothetical protein
MYSQFPNVRLFNILFSRSRWGFGIRDLELLHLIALFSANIRSSIPQVAFLGSAHVALADTSKQH